MTSRHWNTFRSNMYNTSRPDVRLIILTIVGGFEPLLDQDLCETLVEYEYRSKLVDGFQVVNSTGGKCIDLDYYSGDSYAPAGSREQ